MVPAMREGSNHDWPHVSLEQSTIFLSDGSQVVVSHPEYDSMFDLHAALPWVLWLSGITFLGSLVVLPIVIIRMPSDYFARSQPRPESWRARHPAIRVVGLIAKNFFGATFLLAGMVMLFTPGQGILAVLVGVSLMDIPGKRAWERRIVAYARVHRALNGIRARAGQPPLELPDQESNS